VSKDDLHIEFGKKSIYMIFMPLEKIIDQLTDMNGMRPPHVLLVDDSETDAELSMLALRKMHVAVQISWFKDGIKALQYLRDLGPHDPIPDLMMLDLKMPGISGFEVLETLEQEKLKLFPVVVFSGSGLPDDQFRVQQLGGDDFYEKPFDYFTNIRLFRKIFLRWIPLEEMA